ncbi:hypothetical protein [Desertibacillus haloalkaliphilus]|uniref:hypothetical protein n=1 Tax=Desertibacillus haloalkaliphilus TaxID=1328930 RepID=UPI001C252D11|nr:hypothetical protein [Desertibacillus haloalkaliphilus]MBU8905471.1 hypothetical protein [Desertibacillus haloalkaliphilus]
MDIIKKNYEPKEIFLWSIALPGFGQLLNQKYIKGIVFILLEFIINVQARLNVSIVHSFQGDMDAAIQVLDYQWAMFYPCLYIFAMFDSYCDALKINKKQIPKYLSIPFAVSAYITTLGVVYSNVSTTPIFLGPIFLPILSMVLGFMIGALIRRIFLQQWKATIP